jgi:endonuclease YncB( thermonuclease family)
MRLWLTLLLVAITHALPASAIDTVARFDVTDGDSLRVGDTRIRLHGIDAPEIAQTCRDARGRDWACGTWARTQLVELTRGKRLTCTQRDTDRYGRIVATCTANGQDIAAALVARGAAVAFRRYGLEYVAHEQNARTAKRGLWEGSFDLPDAWRAALRVSEVQPVSADQDCAIKGNISTSGHIYHLPGQRDYANTVINERQGERWFCSEAEARAAGWRRAQR